MNLYTMENKGGDETKVFWFIKIAGLHLSDYYNPGYDSFTKTFWDHTLLGKLIPFTPIIFVDPNDPNIQSETYKPGYMAVYVQDLKFTADGQGPFQLVYMSPSWTLDNPGPLTGPIIYKINKEYSLNQ